MESIATKLIRTLVIVILGSAGSLLMGLSFFGTQVFAQGSPAFQFSLFGLSFSLLISTVKAYPTRIYLLWSAIIFLALPLWSRSLQTMNTTLLIRDIVLSLSMIVSVFLLFLAIVRFGPRPHMIIEIVTWTSGITLTYILSSVVLSSLYQPQDPWNYLLLQISYGFRIGLGVSVGMAAGELLTRRLDAREKELLVEEAAEQ